MADKPPSLTERLSTAENWLEGVDAAIELLADALYGENVRPARWPSAEVPAESEEDDGNG